MNSFCENGGPKNSSSEIALEKTGVKTTLLIGILMELHTKTNGLYIMCISIENWKNRIALSPPWRSDREDKRF
jgi:hypothetical protein